MAAWEYTIAGYLAANFTVCRYTKGLKLGQTAIYGNILPYFAKHLDLFCHLPQQFGRLLPTTLLRSTVTTKRISVFSLKHWKNTLMDSNNYQPDVGMIMQLGVQTEPLDVVKMPTIFRPDEQSSVNKITDPWP